jgi:hypothetical protein
VPRVPVHPPYLCTARMLTRHVLCTHLANEFALCHPYLFTAADECPPTIDDACQMRAAKLPRRRVALLVYIRTYVHHFYLQLFHLVQSAI